MLSRRDLVRSLALAPFVGADSGAAATADWPQQPVRIIYPYAAGSANDIATRLMGIAPLNVEIGEAALPALSR